MEGFGLPLGRFDVLCRGVARRDLFAPASKRVLRRRRFKEGLLLRGSPVRIQAECADLLRGPLEITDAYGEYHLKWFQARARSRAYEPALGAERLLNTT